MIIRRSEWQARSPKSRTSLKNAKGVAVHWNGPKMNPTSHDRCYTMVQSIQRYHMDNRGWNDIAYNGLPCIHGYVFEGRGVNVKSAANGSTSGANSTHYALMGLVGQGDTLTDGLLAGFQAGIDWLRRDGGAGKQITGHQDHAKTACPGPDIMHWVRKGMLEPGSSIFVPPTPAPIPSNPGDLKIDGNWGPATSYKTNLRIGILNPSMENMGSRSIQHLQWLARTTADGYISGQTDKHRLIAWTQSLIKTPKNPKGSNVIRSMARELEALGFDTKGTTNDGRGGPGFVSAHQRALNEVPGYLTNQR